MEKILVASPTYKGMQYCIDEFIQRIKSLTYENYDILIIENSEGDSFFNQLKKIQGIKVLRDNSPGKRGIDRIVHSRNMVLDYAKEKDYGYILMMDCDVLPPKNIIQELLATKKDIVSGLYFNQFIMDMETKTLPVAWKQITPPEYEEMKRKYILPEIVKSHEDLRRHLTQEEVNSNELHEVKYASAGCLLISRKVFEKIRYGLLKVEEETSDDIYFMDKARDAGFQPFCHTKLKCEHLIFGKFEKINGELHHPAWTKK
ncbi:MAG: glycosyltransferase family A protein [archaeon]